MGNKDTKVKTVNYKLIIVQAVVIIVLWIIPFVIPFKYSLINLYSFLTFSLIPLILFSVAFIVYLLSIKGNEQDKKMIYIANAIDILAVVAFVAILFFNNAVTNTQENKLKAEKVSQSIDCNYFVGVPEDENTKYTASSENTVGHRPFSVEKGMMGYIDKTFSYYEDLDMTLCKDSNDEKYTYLNASVCYFDNFPKFMSNLYYKKTIRDINKYYDINNKDDWSYYQTDDGYKCASHYTCSAPNELGVHSYVLVVEKENQLLIVDLSGIFPNTEFDNQKINDYYADFMRTIK